MAEQFCLRWNNHQSTLVSVFENLLESETLTDCTLAAEGRYLKAHKVVLSACSPYFETLLCQHYDKHPIVVLKDVKFYEMKAMLDYMYRGEVNISQDQLDAFIKTAESLQIKGLTDQGGGGGGGGDPNHRDRDEERGCDKGNNKRKAALGKNVGDLAPESPLVGNAPLREGSVSPSSHKRRRRHHGTPRPSHNESSSSAPVDPQVESSNSCDTPSVGAPAPPTDSARLLVRKTEPPDIVVQPKLEAPDEDDPHHHQQDIEDLTLDDEDDYGEDSMPKPGTSYGTPSMNQDYSQWPISGDRSTDEVFMAAQEAINNQSNSQGFEKFPHHNVCVQCGRVYKYRDNLKRHLAKECGKDPAFPCQQCPYRSNQKSNLLRHVAYVHDNGPKDFRCSICSYECRQRSDLNRHLVKHEMTGFAFKPEFYFPFPGEGS